jgi:pimeloyl-ACP methyl ester carboxylesterase
VAAVVLLAGCARADKGVWVDGGPPSIDPPGPATRILWDDCHGEAERIAGTKISGPRAQCGAMQVAADWTDPAGPLLDLALLRIPHTGRNPIGSLLVNPGGPGASGVELAAYAALFLPAEIRQRFDIIGFDPRGVGRSTPVACISDADKDATTAADPDPPTQQAFDEQVTLARNVGIACGEKYGDALGVINTEQTARDMDAIRAAVGDQKLTYLGYSYGTLIGSVYAKLFPDHVRALVLDGAVDPRQDSVVASESQAAGFEHAFDAFAADCERRGKGCPIDPDARASVTQLISATRTKPVPGRDGEKRAATAGYTLLAVVAALYSQEQWKDLATALRKLRDGDPTGVFALADDYNERGPDGKYSNQTDAHLAVSCTDEQNSPKADRIRSLQQTWHAKYPLFGGALALSLLGCSDWPAERDPYPTGAATGSPPIVVVGTTGDPATPYENAQKLAAQLGTGRLLTWQGEGHTAYPQTKCIRDAVDGYLLRGQAPPEGKRCPKT